MVVSQTPGKNVSGNNKRTVHTAVAITLTDFLKRCDAAAGKRLVDNLDVLQSRLGTLLDLCSAAEVLAPFTVSGYGDGRDGMQLLHDAGFNRAQDGARMFVNDADFPVTSMTDDVDFEYVKFNHDPSTDEVLAEFEALRLVRPTVEDPFRFAIKYPDEQRKAHVVFLHEPFRDDLDELRVMSLDRGVNGWDLDDNPAEQEWDRHCLFVARRPRS